MWCSAFCAERRALEVLALAAGEEGCLLNAPDVYMDKVATGPGLPEGVVDLDKTPEENLRDLAKAMVQYAGYPKEQMGFDAVGHFGGGGADEGGGVAGGGELDRRRVAGEPAARIGGNRVQAVQVLVELEICGHDHGGAGDAGGNAQRHLPGALGG